MVKNRKLTIRKKDGKKIRNVISKQLGKGIECGMYNTQNKRNYCNNNINHVIHVPLSSIQCGDAANVIHINDMAITLNNQIGKGDYGVVYLANVHNKNEEYDIIIKKNNSNVSEQENALESKLLSYLSKLLENNLSPHFLHFYNEIKCGGQTATPSMTPQPMARPGLFRMQKNTTLTLPKIQSLFLVEKATGTLDNILHNRNVDLQSIISQTILSIYMYHQYTHYYHLDTHIGNFLYLDIKDSNNEYLKYKFNNTVYHLDISKFIVILWDYGKSKPMLNQLNINITDDYIRIIKEIVSYLKIQNIVLSEIKKILKTYNNIINNNLYNKNPQEILKYNIIMERELLKQLIAENLIFDTKKMGTTPYKDIPYILDNITPLW